MAVCVCRSTAYDWLAINSQQTCQSSGAIIDCLYTHHPQLSKCTLCLPLSVLKGPNCLAHLCSCAHLELCWHLLLVSLWKLAFFFFIMILLCSWFIVWLWTVSVVAAIIFPYCSKMPPSRSCWQSTSRSYSLSSHPFTILPRDLSCIQFNTVILVIM